MISDNLKHIRQRIQALDDNHQVTLIAVSKTKPASDLQQAIDCGQKHFGENYLQEALDKIQILSGQDLIWHFIGPIQSNKTSKIAENFDWVHSVDRLKIAKRLNEQRPDSLEKLQILLQVNIDNESSKSGVLVDEVDDLVSQIQAMDHLVLRGFMCIPKPGDSEDSFQAMEKLLARYPELDTLSMGMSADLESAIKHGATFVRIGTDIFGQRDDPA